MFCSVTTMVLEKSKAETFRFLIKLRYPKIGNNKIPGIFRINSFK